MFHLGGGGRRGVQRHVIGTQKCAAAEIASRVRST